MQKCKPLKMQNISISRALSKKLCKTLHISNLVETCVIDQMAEGNFVVEIINRDQLWQFDISWIVLIFTHLHMSHCQMLGKFEYGLPAKF